MQTRLVSFNYQYYHLKLETIESHFKYFLRFGICNSILYAALINTFTCVYGFN